MLVRKKIDTEMMVRFGRLSLTLMLIACAAEFGNQAVAQPGVLLGNVPVVGGVEIETDGVLNNRPIRLSDELKAQLQQNLQAVDSELGVAGMRVISLKSLDELITKYKNEGKSLPLAVQYLGGMQRVEYVYASPESGDVIIAGPGEGLTTDANGNVVGSESGMPPVSLEDFLVAMRYVDNARQGYGISVSIDPTDEGVENVQRALKRIRPSEFNQQTATALEQACGEQIITLTGVPKDSRFSTVLVSADYKMKRLAMGLEASPDYLPSILHMAKAQNSNIGSISPRFWMETNYQPLSVSTDRSVWRINGQGVCTKTQETRSGQTGDQQIKSNKLAVAWAKKMTENYNRLSVEQPVFRELRNLMDLSVVAAVIAREKLIDKVDLQIPAILGTDTVALPSWNVPRKVPTQCSYTFLPSSMIVTTSGGVTIDSWRVAANTMTDDSLKKLSESMVGGANGRWWWNANTN